MVEGEAQETAAGQEPSGLDAGHLPARAVLLAFTSYVT